MPGENARTGAVLSWVILLLVIWIAYRVTVVPPPSADTGDDNESASAGNCRWVTDAGRQVLLCTVAGGGTVMVDTTGVGSGGQ